MMTRLRLLGCRAPLTQRYAQELGKCHVISAGPETRVSCSRGFCSESCLEIVLKTQYFVVSTLPWTAGLSLGARESAVAVPWICRSTSLKLEAEKVIRSAFSPRESDQSRLMLQHRLPCGD